MKKKVRRMLEDIAVEARYTVAYTGRPQGMEMPAPVGLVLAFH